MKIKIKPADTWFSRCIRERSEWKCERCGKQYEYKGHGLDCSHHYSRRHRAVRWCSDNASSHCRGCHQYLGSNPLDFSLWIENKLGPGAMEILTEKKNQIAKVSKDEERDIAKHYKQQFEEMRKKRDEGVTGWLDFESWQ